MIDTASYEELLANHHLKLKIELEDIQDEQKKLIDLNKKIIKKLGIS